MSVGGLKRRQLSVDREEVRSELASEEKIVREVQRYDATWIGRGVRQRCEASVVSSNSESNSS